MPLLFWLDIASLIISTVIATALALMVLQAGPRRIPNHLFVLFILTKATWAALVLLLRITLWLPIDTSILFLELGTLACALIGPFLLLFTVHYVNAPVAVPGNQPSAPSVLRTNLTRWANPAAIVGLVAMAILSVLLFRHQLVFNLRLDVGGAIIYDLGALGLVLASLPVLYTLWSLILLCQARQRTGKSYLATSALILLVGFIVNGLFIPPFPIMSITTTLSTIVLGAGIVSRQLFNPLQELTEGLGQREEEHTQELAQAIAQLTIIHTVGQKLVLSKNEVEIARLVVDAAWQVLYVPVCGLWLVDDEQKSIARLVYTSRKEPHKTLPPFSLDDEQGIVVSVVRLGEPIYLPDTSQEPRYVDGGFHSRSELCVPLRVGEQVIGALNAESEKLDGFGPADRQLLEALANSAAIAIQNARLYEAMQQELVERKRAEEEAQRRAAQTALIYKVGQRVSSKLELKALLSEIVTAVHDAFDYYSVMLFLLDAEARRLTLQSIAGGYVNIFPSHLSIAVGEGMIGHAATTGETQVSGDVSQNPHYMRKADEMTQSELAAPIKSKQKVIGVLDLQGNNLNAFDETDVILMETLADQVAGAIENARLYEAIQQELTERKRVEEALAYERDLLYALMDNTPDAIYFKDVDSRFVRVNRTQAQVLLGVNDPDKAIGKTDFDFFTKEHAQDAYEDEQEIVRSGQPLTDKLEEIRRADGQIRWVSTTKVPLIGKGGQVAGTIGITRDITERKQAEEQLQRYAAEMERANEEVKRFAYIVSHDLRAPLVNLKGFAAELDMALGDIQSAIDTALPHLSEDQRQTITYALYKDIPESLKFINSSVEHMDSFISALLKLSRLGRRELKLEQVDMNDVVDAILPTLAHQIAEHQGEVKVEQLPNVIADRTSMEQIMSNILGNAVKYLTSDQPAEIKVTAERNDDETIFRIQDNGCGIAESDMEKVFTPFRRAGKQDVPGEGMGLAYVQTLVRRHGGRIWYESELGTGTTFTFTLPNHPKGADYA